MKYFIFNAQGKTRNQVLGEISQFALTKKIATNSTTLKNAFIAREKEGTTGFEAGFAIPHARIKSIEESAVIIARLKAGVDWQSLDGQKAQTIIAILVKNDAKAGSEHMAILSQIATNIMDLKKRNIYRQGTLAEVKQLSQNSSNKQSKVTTNLSSKTKIVGITACATGVAHTYMAQKALIDAGTKLKMNVRIETQGQKGQESTLTTAEIAQAEAVVIAADIGVDLDRFEGKKVLMANTNEAIKDGAALLQKTLKEAKFLRVKSDGNIIGSGNQRGVMSHILTGVSRMIPFIVFSGIVWAILNSLTQAGIRSHELDLAISGAQVGFTFFIAIMGGFIGESVAGRAALAPCAIATYVASAGTMFWHWNGLIPDVYARSKDFHEIVNAAGAHLKISTGWTIVGAIGIGLLGGKLVQKMNQIKLPPVIMPMLPIIIIPVIATSLLVFPIIFIFGAPVDYIISSLGMLIGVGGQITGVNFMIGFVLGAMIGFDMGGPVNKIAGATATALIQVDPRLLGAVEAAIPIAPLGVGLSTLIYRNVFDKTEKGLGMAALGLGFFGISEGAIPFAAKRPKITIIVNTVTSAIAGGLSFMFFVGGHVGMWGGPIVALVLGVYADNGQLGYHIPGIFGGVSPYLSILWFFVAIGVGMTIHAIWYGHAIKRANAGKGMFTKKPMRFKRHQNIKINKIKH